MIVDTRNKTVELADDENIGDVVAALEKMFPDGSWQKFQIVPKTITVTVKEYIYNQPWRIDPEPYIPPIFPTPWVQPYYQHYGPSINCDVTAPCNIATTTSGYDDLLFAGATPTHTFKVSV